MNGVKGDEGLVMNAGRRLFEEVRKLNHQNVAIEMSAFELYNEYITDMLDDSKTRLSLRCVGEEVQVGNLTRQHVKSYEEFEENMAQMMKKNLIRGTMMSITSSRKFTIISIHFQQVKDNKKIS